MTASPTPALRSLSERPVQLQGSRVAATLLRWAGWRVVFRGLPGPQGVIALYPHTSNWDFVVGVLAKWSIGISITFWAKDSLFKVPLLGAWMRWLGGQPVDRRAPQGLVGQMRAGLIAARERGAFMWLVVTPEGTRAYRDHWRTGFYHLVRDAQVPLGLASLDYARREVLVDTFVRISGDVDADMQGIAAHYRAVVGKHPAQAAPIRFKP